MSDHKINQKMDLGDIVYIIIALILMIFGFFNKSKQNQKQEKQSKRPKPIPSFSDVLLSKEDESDYYDQSSDEMDNLENFDHVIPPPPSRPVFQSSMDLVTDFEKESSIHPVGSTYSKDEQRYMVQSIEKVYDEQHDLLRDLLRDNAGDELKKAILYKEILEPRF